MARWLVAGYNNYFVFRVNVLSQERALVVVSYLATRQPFFFYRATEWTGIKLAQQLLGKHYQRVIVLRGQEGSYAALQNSVNMLVADASIKAIDLIINLHGSRSTLVFAANEHISYEALTFATGASQKLRLVYSTACYGASNNKWWLNAGFKAAIGAVSLNINALTEYPALLRAWAKGYSVAEIVRRAAGPAGRATDVLGRLFSGEVDSRKVASGRVAVTISCMPEPLA